MKEIRFLHPPDGAGALEGRRKARKHDAQHGEVDEGGEDDLRVRCVWCGGWGMQICLHVCTQPQAPGCCCQLPPLARPAAGGASSRISHCKKRNIFGGGLPLRVRVRVRVRVCRSEAGPKLVLGQKHPTRRAQPGLRQHTRHKRWCTHHTHTVIHAHAHAHTSLPACTKHRPCASCAPDT